MWNTLDFNSVNIDIGQHSQVSNTIVAFWLAQFYSTPRVYANGICHSYTRTFSITGIGMGTVGMRLGLVLGLKEGLGQGRDIHKLNEP